MALIRISGPYSQNVLTLLTGKEVPGRRATLCQFRDPATSELIDSGIALFYPKPKSYTGEDVCEIMVHGSKAVVAKFLQTLGSNQRLRPAEAGEFTKRALINGKLDMTEAEAVRELIESSTESQRKRAITAVSGKTSDMYRRWRTRLVKCLADLEANIEFGEDYLLEDETMKRLKSDTICLKSEVDNYIKEAGRFTDLTLEGFKIVIIGQPNVGKSSLINAITSRDVSIVSSMEGTTRDVVEVSLDISGHLVTLSDTAGLRELHDSFDARHEIERLGIEKAKQRAAGAHLILSVRDPSSQQLTAEIRQITETNDQVRIINVLNKCDLLQNGQDSDDNRSEHPVCRCSCKTGEGIQDLMTMVRNELETIHSSCDSGGFITQRQMSHLQGVSHHMEQSNAALDRDLSISAHHLKKAAVHLSSLTEVITGEDVLDVIFRDFCIGK